MRQFSRSAFHLGHLSFKKIHDGGLEDRRMGSAFSVDDRYVIAPAEGAKADVRIQDELR